MSHGSSESDWRVGTAKTTITPTEPMWMAGFGFRDEPAAGVEEDLHVRALAIEDGHGNRVVVLSVELLFVSAALRDRLVRERLTDVELDDDQLLISATHTHCGPEYRDLKLRMFADDPEQYRAVTERYRDQVVADFASVVRGALEDLSPAAIAFDYARCGFAMNRRRPTADGIGHVPNPDGPVDPTVPVLVARSNDTVQALLFGYPCHPTTVMRCDGWMRYNGDWAGYAQAGLEDTYPEATALFIQGCTGDLNPYPRGSLELARHHGQTVRNAVEVAVDASRTAVSGPLRTLMTKQSVELSGPPDSDTLAGWIDSDDRVDNVRGAVLREELAERGAIDTTRSIPIQGIGFGEDLTLLALGGEVLINYARRLKDSHPGPCWVAGYANSGFTYVPTATAVYEGGYEGEDAFRYAALPGPPKPTIEDRVIRRSKTVLDRVGRPQ